MTGWFSNLFINTFIYYILINKMQIHFMRKLSLLSVGLFSMLLSFSARAQSNSGADYFAGKWNVLMKGLPDGDTKMFFVLEKKDTTLTGTVLDSVGTQIAKIDSVQITASTATIYFVAQSYNVNFLMNKKTDDHITGSLMGMFDAEGDRVKATK